MEEWELLDRTENERREAQKQALWHALEDDLTIPEASQLEHLSGLLDSDITRIAAALAALPTPVRRELIRTLNQRAAADFRMDFSAIFRIAVTDADAEVRTAAVEGLFEVEDIRLVPVLAALLHDDSSPEVRAAAAQALGSFVLLGELQKIRPGPFEAAVAALHATYADPAEAGVVQRSAMESLAYTSAHDVPALIARAYADGDEPMRVSALRAMGRSADKIWGDIVRRELANPRPAMRLEATRACGELQLREAVREVVEMTEDVDATIRLAAIWSLGQIGGNLARKTLQRCARADDLTMAEAADRALQELEFLYGDLNTFFGAPSEYDGETDGTWRMPTLADLPDEDGNAQYYGDEDEDDLEDNDLYVLDDDDPFATDGEDALADDEDLLVEDELEDEDLDDEVYLEKVIRLLSLSDQETDDAEDSVDPEDDEDRLGD